MEKTNCPDCKNEILTDHQYHVWCQNCNWNLKFEDNLIPKTKLDEFYKKLSDKHSKFLFERIKNNEIDISLKIKPMRFLAYTISIIIILINFSLLLVGLYLLFGWHNNVEILIGLMLLGLFWLSKPTIDKLPKDDFAEKKQFEELYKLVNLVCKKLNTSEVEGIIINEEFNAGITEFGISRKKVLWIGLPFWTILNNEEKVALLAHEISHCTNNDPNRSIITSKGIYILIDTANAIYPEHLIPRVYSIDNGLTELLLEISKFLVVPINLLLRTFAHILWKGAELLFSIVWLDSQRAEYLADLSGTKISGKNSAIDLMHKLSNSRILDFEIQKLSVKTKKEIDKLDLFEILKNKVDILPEHEKERLKRLQEFEEHRLDSTHPPTHFRKLMLEAKGYENIENFDNIIDFEKIEQELKYFRPKIQNKLIDEYKSYLYQFKDTIFG